MRTKLLIIEDDTDLQNELFWTLTSNAYDVLRASSGNKAREIVASHTIDICILDIGLPDCSGFDLCQQLHDNYHFPILILTAWGNEDDIIRGLESGADDYVIKPCSAKVLTARLRALLRRRQGNYQNISLNTAVTGNLFIDFEHKTIVRNDDALPLKETEYEICELLIKNYGLIMTRDKLISTVWSDNNRFVMDNTLSVHMSRIRKTLGSFGGLPYIETIRGFGYRWNPEVSFQEKN